MSSNTTTAVAHAEHAALPGYSSRPASPTSPSQSAASEDTSPLSSPSESHDSHSSPPIMWTKHYADMEDELPEYSPRESRKHKHARAPSDPATQLSPAMMAIFEEERRHRLSRQRSQSAAQGPVDRWVRWSAKFYMPMMGRWDHRKSV